MKFVTTAGKAFKVDIAISWCMIKIFMGGEEVLDGKGVAMKDA